MNCTLALALIFASGSACCATDPAGWIPARWEGGPLELSRRAENKTDASTRTAIGRWYEPATLDLLDGTPINCLLVSFSAGAESEVERKQQQVVKEYARLAHKRGISLVGLIYAGADPQTVAAAAMDADLDGVAIEGETSGGFPEKLETALRAKGSAALVIPIVRDAARARTSNASLLAVEGVRPIARNLADEGIRAGASAEPWIDSNIWLVRSFRLRAAWRPVWIDQRPNPSSEGDYVRCVADAAVAGGRWIVALDDELRMKLLRKDAQALATWRSIGTYLRFAEDHAEWRSFVPYGNLGMILDTAGENPDIANEYLNLVARRQVPYRVVPRCELNAASLAGFRAVLAVDLASPTETERSVLRAFAENGGLVVAGPWWGDAPKDDAYAELPLGKGRVAVYKEDPPNPETVARDLVDLLEPEVMGLSVFNVPTAISYASTRGKRVLVQLLNYAGKPIERVTLRFNGNFKVARLYTPEGGSADLAPRPAANGRTEVLIPKLAAWGAVLLEEQN